MRISETIDYHIRGALFAMRRMYNFMAADLGTTQGVAYVLINVPHNGIAATSIAPMMGMSATSLTRLLKTMEEDGLIYRRKSQDDRRVVMVLLTEKGQHMRRKARQVVIDFNKMLFEKLNNEDAAAFIRVCQLIRLEANGLINGRTEYAEE
ncbi:MAG TPA: MarR family transcriptional regulator [Bacteroidales bacterium]|nr:MarR family transcriptional regulator [Bacteroidales bacterium]